MGQIIRALLSRWSIFAGFLAILSYWYFVRPNQMGLLGFADDLGMVELTRQIMADSLTQHGRPDFFATRVMAPFGVNAAFYSWAMERDWIGAWVWMWNRDFPWLWVYYGLSLSLSYFGVGFILRKMGMSRLGAWGLACGVVLFHVPRHFKTYLHYEHLIHHWVYLGAFVDAWLWQEFWRDKKWSLRLEAWRGFFQIAVMGLAGYYWGGLMLEWVIMRACLGVTFYRRHRRGETTQIEWSPRALALPLGLSAIWVVIEAFWFIPLFKSYREFGDVWQASGWTTEFWEVFRPLWLDALWPQFQSLWSYGDSETVVVLGWVFCFPLVLSFWLNRKRSGGPGVGAIFPFLLWFTLAVFYLHGGWLYFVQSYLRHTIPFMKFFRVASRMAVFIPIIAGALIALGAPELKKRWQRLSLGARVGLATVFLLMAGLELQTFRWPVMMSAVASDGFLEMMSRIREQPGDQILDLPFCVTGGNSACQAEQCPHWNVSVAPASLTGLHSKKVYGVYQGRLSEKQCQIYRREPYTQWFQAWREKRCFNPEDWKAFCAYLKTQPSLAGVLLYPGIWKETAHPECLAEFDRRLGEPLGVSQMATHATPGGYPSGITPVLWYSPRCLND